MRANFNSSCESLLAKLSSSGPSSGPSTDAVAASDARAGSTMRPETTGRRRKRRKRSKDAHLISYLISTRTRRHQKTRCLTGRNPKVRPQRHHGRTDCVVYVSCSIRNHYTVCLRKQPQTARFQYGRRATRGACAEQDVERITFSRACELGGWCQAGLQVGKSREERLSKNKRNWSTEITKVLLTLTWPIKSALSPLNRQCAAMRARGGVAAGLAP